jgi:predicted nucleic acid-binding protein
MGFERGLSRIPTGKKVFIDANIFLYEVFNHPKFGENAYRILKDVENGVIKGITSTLVLDEVLHKMILIEVSEKFNFPMKDTVPFLKKNPKEIPLLDSSWKDIDRIQEIENLTVVGISPDVFKNSINIAKKNMLLAHDAQHVAVMKYESISNIASNDGDFERVEGITVWKP